MARPGYAGCLTDDVTGVVRGMTDNQGTTTIQTHSSTNYAVPSQITDTQTGVNGEVVNFDYDTEIS